MIHLNRYVKKIVKTLLDKRYRELQRLGNLPRYKGGITTIFGKKLAFIDGPSMVPLYEEIFGKEIYRFESKTTTPLIIDGGANVGVSVVYFKKLFPDSFVVAFEPDDKAFEALQKNVQSFELTNVTLVKKALWSSNTELNFLADGADSGRVMDDGPHTDTVLVRTERLRDLLDQPIEFLKLDIEGAEYEVLSDCEGQLGNVSNLFVEYHSYHKQPQQLHHLFDILQSSGFRVYVHSNLVAARPFVEKANYNCLDMTVNIFAVRE